eukprot:10402478-Alexandrium_andersonii.AAC.1
MCIRDSPRIPRAVQPSAHFAFTPQKQNAGLCSRVRAFAPPRRQDSRDRQPPLKAAQPRPSPPPRPPRASSAWSGGPPPG